MIKVFSKTLVTGSGNEMQGFQHMADQVAKYLEEKHYTMNDVKWLQSCASSRITLTAIVG